MTYLLLQTFLLLLAAYFLGAFLGCLAKRALRGGATGAFAAEGAAMAAPAAAARSPARPAEPLRVAVPRAIEPVQPKIDILSRPEPRPQPAVIDTSRFERALLGPDPNENMPRTMIVELRPLTLKSATGPAPPRAPQAIVEPPRRPPPAPAPMESTASRAPMMPSATAAAAAAAVAAAKAAAAASAASAVRSTPPAPVKPQAPAAPPAVVAPPTAAAEAPLVMEPPKPAPMVVSAPKPAPPPATPLPAPPAAPPAVAKPDIAAPVVAQTDTPALQSGGDDLQRIRAIDANTENRLKSMGVRRFVEIAGWSPADVNRVNQSLGLDGRIEREQWIDQAQILAKGGETYYSRNRLAAQRPASAAPTGQPATAAPMVSGAAKATSQDGLAPARSVAEMAAAAAAAIAAASASVTRGVRPIEPISPLSKVDPKVVIPARLTDAIRSREPQTPAPPAATAARPVQPENLEDGAGDDLKRIRGIGVLIEKRLAAMGITSYDQIANWTRGDIDRIDQSLELRGRIEREKWVEQARILSSGGQTEFSRRVDKGDVESSLDDE